MEASHGVLPFVQGIVNILLIATIVLALCKKIKFPFTVALVIVGLGIANLDKIGFGGLHNALQLRISPDLIMFVFLPTLIFESAFNLDGNTLKRNIVPVLTLAVPGLLLSTATIGSILWLLSPFDFASSLLLGAILSATDPVAVIALFKQLGAPKRLTVLVEGESLFNDATSVVTAKILFAVVVAGSFSMHHLGHGLLEFLWEFVGGVVIGWVMAVIVAYIIGLVESDIYIEISLTMILAYASFIVAQEVFHSSGIMATVAAGVVLGGWGRVKISPSVAHFLHEYWEYLAFIANALIFLLVGLIVDLSQFNFMIVLLLGLVIVSMLLSRALVIYGLLPLITKLPGAPQINRPYQHVMYWGGLRGAIALAIVLGLGEFKHANEFMLLVSGAVLFTLLVQGLSMEKLVRWLGLDKPPLNEQLATVEAKLAAKRHATEDLPELQKGGLFSASIARELANHLQEEIHVLNNQLTDLMRTSLNDHEEHRLLILNSLAAMKSHFYQMFSRGHFSEQSYRMVNYLVDVQRDFVKYWNRLTEKYQPHAQQRYYKQKIYQILDSLPFAKTLTEYMRSMDASRDYEIIWAQHQGSRFVLEHLEEVSHSENHHPDLLQKVSRFFSSWMALTKSQLDAIAEQFPEFVTQMQKRLAQRLIIQSEKAMVQEQAHAGTLPEGVAHAMIAELDERALSIRQQRPTRLSVDTRALLRKVPFFAELPERNYDNILDILKEHTLPVGENIIKEGDIGRSMYFIIRGVVRVMKRFDGEDRDLATLVAGDFFGEMALLHQEPRTATCRAVTPCIIYELTNHDLVKVQESCPAIKDAMEVADRERRQAFK